MYYDILGEDYAEIKASKCSAIYGSCYSPSNSFNHHRVSPQVGFFLDSILFFWINDVLNVFKQVCKKLGPVAWVSLVGYFKINKKVKVPGDARFWFSFAFFLSEEVYTG